MEILADHPSGEVSKSEVPQRMNASIWVRLVIVQTQNHQAAKVACKSFMHEPFVDLDCLPLETMIRNGLRVEDLQQACFKRYSEWSMARLQAVLEFIRASCLPKHSTKDSCQSAGANPKEPAEATIKPETQAREDEETRPSSIIETNMTVVVFPEYALPFEQLVNVKEFVDNLPDAYGPVAVFAGTHTLPPRTSANMDLYTQIGASAVDLSACYESRLPTRSLQVVFIKDNRVGASTRTEIRQKLVLSPYEFTSTEPHAADAIDLKNRILDVYVDKNRVLKLCLLICSEALQTSTVGHDTDFDIAIIPAYSEPRHFQSVTEQLSRNRRVAVFCNDGRYGGSGFFIPRSRHGDSWWFGEPNNSQLPKGDCLLCADVAITQLADVTQVNNPSERCRLNLVADILPETFEEHPSLVSMVLSELRKRECQPCGPETVRRVNVEERREILRDCLESEWITPLQERKLQRLIAYEELPSSVWAFHATDVLFALNDDQRVPTTSLLNLEKWLANYCLDRCRVLINSDEHSREGHEAIRVAVEAFHSKVRQQGYRSPRKRRSLSDGLWEFLAVVRDESRKHSYEDIADITSGLVERFRAASAFVLAHSPHVELLPGVSRDRRKPLVTLYAHHTRSEPYYPLEGTMAGLCVETAAPVVYPLISVRGKEVDVQPFYPSNPRTKSAVAVPVLRQVDGAMSCGGVVASQSDVVGVLVLESPNEFQFNFVDGVELMLEASNTFTAIAFFADQYTCPLSAIAWYPSLNIPDLRSLKKRMLLALVKAASPVGSGMLGASLWEMDKDIDPAGAFPVAAVGYDVEYQTRHYLPVATSFIGSMLTGKSEPCEKRNWRSIDTFWRRRKAERSSLDCIYAASVRCKSMTNLGSPRGELCQAPPTQIKGSSTENQQKSSIADEATQELSESLPAEMQHSQESKHPPTHVLVFHTFLETERTVHQTLSCDQLLRSSELLGKILSKAASIEQQSVVAKMTAKLARESLGGDTLFHLIRDFLMDLFDAAGVSILAVARRSNEDPARELKFFSTSGLGIMGIEATDPRPYAIEPQSPHDSVRVLFEEDAIIRRNFRVETVRSDAAVRRYVESYTLSENEHRKSMLLRIPGTVNWQKDCHTDFGVVRLIRTSANRHFSNADKELASTIAQSLVNTFVLNNLEDVCQSQNKITSICNAIAEIHRTTTIATGHDFLASRCDAVKLAFRRILCPTLGFVSWSDARVREIIRDLFFLIDRKRCTLVMMQMVTRDRSGIRTLVPRYFHTHSDIEISEDQAGEFSSEDVGGIGWHAIRRWEALTTNFTVGEHEPYTLSQKESRVALTIPLVVMFPDHCALATVTCEWAGHNALQSQESPDEHDWSIALLGCIKLCWLAAGNGCLSMPNKERIQNRCSTSAHSDSKSFITNWSSALVAWHQATQKKNECSFELCCQLFDGDECTVFDVKSDEKQQSSCSGFTLANSSPAWHRFAFEHVGVDRDHISDSLRPERMQTYFVKVSQGLAHSTIQYVQTVSERAKIKNALRRLADASCILFVGDAVFLVIPLTFGGISFGEVRIRIDRRDSMAEMPLLLESLLNELIRLWTEKISDAAYYWEDFGVQVKQTKSNKQTISYRIKFATKTASFKESSIVCIVTNPH